MSAVYRLSPAGLFQPAGVFASFSLGDLIQKQPALHRAVASERRFLFTETELGMCPLALVGTLTEIDDTLLFFQDHVIENRLDTGTHLYVGIKRYEPGPLYDGLYPLEEVAKRVARMAAAVTPVPGVTDLLKNLVDAAGLDVNLAQELNEVIDFVDEHGDDLERIKDLLLQRDTGKAPFLIHPDQEFEVLIHYAPPRECAVSIAELPTTPGVFNPRSGQPVTTATLSFIELRRLLHPLLVRVTTWLPTFEQWKQSSSAGRLSIRRRSRITQVDRAYLTYLQAAGIRAEGGGDRAQRLADLVQKVQAYRHAKDEEGSHHQRVAACVDLLGTLQREGRWIGAG